MSYMLLPVRVAGKSHAGWSRPALHAAPTALPQRRLRVTVNLQDREENLMGESYQRSNFTKGQILLQRKLLLSIVNQKKGRIPDEAILSVTAA